MKKIILMLYVLFFSTIAFTQSSINPKTDTFMIRAGYDYSDAHDGYTFDGGYYLGIKLGKKDSLMYYPTFSFSKEYASYSIPVGIEQDNLIVMITLPFCGFTLRESDSCYNLFSIASGFEYKIFEFSLGVGIVIDNGNLNNQFSIKLGYRF